MTRPRWAWIVALAALIGAALAPGARPPRQRQDVEAEAELALTLGPFDTCGAPDPGATRST
jgi:hypothetical protein